MMKPLLDEAKSALEEAGFGQPPLAESRVDDRLETASFTIEPIVLRFLRERGEDFLDVATSSCPSSFSQFDDVAIALGLRTVDEVIARTQPEALVELLGAAKANWKVIEAAFRPERLEATLVNIERATASRAFAFQAKMS
jgi:hypothetical protein